MSNSLRPHGLQHARSPCPLPILELTQIQVCRMGDPIQPSHPLSSPLPLPSVFPSMRVFSNESFLCIRLPKYWSFSFSINLPMNIQDWFPLGWTGWISLQSKGLSRAFSSTRVQKYQFFSAQPYYGLALSSICDYWKNHSFDCMDLCQQSNCLCFLICFLVLS